MEIEKDWQVDMEYAVRLKYEGLSIEDISKILDTVIMNKRKWVDLDDPIIKRDREYFEDGWGEPLETWNVTIPINNCSGINLDSYNKYFSSDIAERFSGAEELAAEINKALGIE